MNKPIIENFIFVWNPSLNGLTEEKRQYLTSQIDIEIDLFSRAFGLAFQEINKKANSIKIDKLYDLLFEKFPLNKYYVEDAVWIAQKNLVPHNYSLIKRRFIFSKSRTRKPWGNQNLRIFFDKTVDLIYLQLIISHSNNLEYRAEPRVQGSLDLINGEKEKFISHLVDAADLYDAILIKQDNGSFQVQVGFWNSEQNSESAHLYFLRNIVQSIFPL